MDVDGRKEKRPQRVPRFPATKQTKKTASILIILVVFALILVSLLLFSPGKFNKKSGGEELKTQLLEKYKESSHAELIGYSNRYIQKRKDADKNIPKLIIMDWIVDSALFGYINYKSLESLLATYPTAEVKVLLIGPQAADYYKCGNLLSKHYFHKYQKRGKIYIYMYIYTYIYTIYCVYVCKGYHIKFEVKFKHPGGTNNLISIAVILPSFIYN